MYITKKITNDLFWIGANDRRLAMFEGVYSVPRGVSYNSYLLKDNKTVLFDTVDKAVAKVFFENLTHELGERSLDYIVVSHMEPDHSATLEDLLIRYPGVKIVCNEKSQIMMNQFFPVKAEFHIVKEGDSLNTGKHELTFINAPMVHWPEVMMTYDKLDKVLFSADAFGAFGALNGAIFADEVDFNAEYMDEARRYYANIVGKYGPQVQAVLKKAATVDIKYLCPLHGFVWRENLNSYIDKYNRWSTYTPEEKGVLVAYASVYGNTENIAELIASKLRDNGVKALLFDVSVTPASEIIAACFKYSHFVFASTTYNAGIFVQMEAFLHDLVAHNIQNRTVALVENGSWAPTSGKLMKELLSSCKNMTFIDNPISIKSRLKNDQLCDIETLVSKITDSVKGTESAETQNDAINEKALFNLSYGLYVLTAKNSQKDNGCIINTAVQLTSNPLMLSVAVNKQNYTHDMILETGEFGISVLSEDVPFKVFKQFGFASGHNADKFADFEHKERSSNGIYHLTKYINSFICAKVTKTEDLGTHTVFYAKVTEAQILSDEPSVTYSYYINNIKQKPTIKSDSQKVWVCKICGYVYDEKAEGVPFSELPDDWVCPLCKHPKSDFELG